MEIDDRTSTTIDWQAEFEDDPDFLALPPDGQKKLLEFLNRSLDMKIAVVYGSEDENVQDACVDCNSLTSTCKAKCCTLIFALTEKEVATGKVKYNKDKPYFIARDEADGYCPHLNRDNYQCEVWDDRPIRCHAYSCQEDDYIWPNGFGKAS
jgi:hypothetical protein